VNSLCVSHTESVSDLGCAYELIGFYSSTH
jgi:hypothetical protein